MKILITIILTVSGLCISCIIFIYWGIYNVSAKAENGFTKLILHAVINNSVEHNSKNITAYDKPPVLAEGFFKYKETCEICHGGPGKKETELAKGLNPPAPDLCIKNEGRKDEELFWIIKNGIKMTGMPSWGKTHLDKQIWTIVAAVKKLPETLPAEYREYKGELKEYAGDMEER